MPYDPLWVLISGTVGAPGSDHGLLATVLAFKGALNVAMFLLVTALLALFACPPRRARRWRGWCSGPGIRWYWSRSPAARTTTS